MQPDHDSVPRHESVDHKHPTDAGMMNDDDEHTPGTGIMGDETLVREVPGGLRLDSPPAGSRDRPSHPHPGPTPTQAMDQGEDKG